MRDHIRDDCPGKWVDISTIAAPRRRMCDTCRVVQPIPLGDEEVAEVLGGEEIPSDIPKFPPTWVLVTLMVTNGLLAIAVLASLIQSWQ